ncbi:MAG: DegT/DnrJ/EryC1/StrS family aminotransferase [Trueperaceae bacterium]|nr:DegT/DnrJ/EryC1/StrS family aminotransferase [Trueperaceae bacterium]
MRNHGSSRTYQHTELGYNSRLDSLQAAILRVKLPHVEGWNRCRAERARAYHDGLADLPGVVLPLPHPSHVWHQYTLRLTGHDRDAVQQALQSAGVASKVYYPTPLHRLPLYEARAPLPVSERAAQQVLSLPMSAQLSQDAQDEVVARLHEILDR